MAIKRTVQKQSTAVVLPSTTLQRQKQSKNKPIIERCVLRYKVTKIRKSKHKWLAKYYVKVTELKKGKRRR